MTIDAGIVDKQSIRAYNTLLIRFTSKHGDTYDYSKFVFKGMVLPSIVVCKEHGEFLTTPRAHTSTGCPKCGITARNKSKIKSTSWFLSKSLATHGSRYDYSKSHYVNCKTRVTIICKEHGEFLQMPYHHIIGSGCQDCAKESRLEAYIDKPTILYYCSIEHPNGTILYKVGITTSTVNKRYRCEIKRGYSINILFIREFTTGKPAFYEEQRIIKKYKNIRYVGTCNFLYRGFGDSELFIKDIHDEFA